MANICLVDDEKALNQVLKVYLEREGHKVTTFYNMQDIYNQVEKFEFENHKIMSDYCSP